MMRCNRARPLLAKQLREDLALTEELALRQHLAGCPGCRSEADDLQALDAILLRSPAVPATPAPPVRVDTSAIVRKRPVTPAYSRWLVAAAVPAALAAASAYWFYARPAASPAGEENVSRHSPPPDGRSPRVAKGAVKPRPEIVAVPSMLPGRPGIDHARQRERVAAPAGHAEGRPHDVALLFRRNLVEKPGARRREPALTQQVAVPALQVQASPYGVKPGQVLPVAFVPTPAPVEESGAVAAPLRGDMRLTSRLILAEKDRTLGELLPRLGKRIHVPLAAGREVADDKLTLFLRERSAAEALTLAARHLGFKWHRTGEGYELRQDLASRRREQALLRNELQPIETQLNLAARWMREPDDRKKERVAALDAQLKSEGLGPEERARLQAEKQTILDVWLSPASVDASLMLFRSLTPAQIDSTLAGTEYRYSTAAGTLPPLIAARVHDSTSILETLHGPLPRLQADVTLTLSDVEDMDELPPSRRDRQLRLRTLFATIRGSKEDPQYWGGGWAPHIPAPVAAEPDANITDADLKQPVELTVPGPERQPPVITGGNMICAAQLGNVWPRRATLADVAEAIQRATGLEVVADSFVSARLDPALVRGRRPLVEVLQKVAEELDYTWEKHGKLLLLRDRRFYRDRPAEVPERLLQPFRAQVLRQGELSLDALSELAARLSDTQSRGMYRYWGWYLEGTGILPTDYFFTDRQHLRFWAGLSPQQRGMLRSGGTLSVAAMLPAQRQLWAEALASPPETARTPASEQRIPTPDEIALGSFSLRITENQAALFVLPSPDGKRQPATGITLEGPSNYDIRKLMHADPNGPQPELAGPPLSLAGYSFNYYVGGTPKPLRQARIMIAPLQKPTPARPAAGTTGKE